MEHILKKITRRLKYYLIIIRSSRVFVSERKYARRVAHSRSTWKAKDFKEFNNELSKFINKKKSLIDFDDKFYLSMHPDVNEACKKGIFECGYIHFCIHGKSEQRLHSLPSALKPYDKIATVGKGLFGLKSSLQSKFVGHLPNISKVAPMKENHMTIIIPEINSDIFYAGYQDFFSKMRDISTKYTSIDILVTNYFELSLDEYLVKQYLPSARIRVLKNVKDIFYVPKIIFVYSSDTFHIAAKLFKDLNRIVYYCQDIEYGFSALGTDYIRAKTALSQSKNLIVSTELLKNYLVDHKLINPTNLMTVAPVITTFDVSSHKNKKLFFYYRPEFYNSRNLHEIIDDAIVHFCEKYSGYTIYLVGSVKTVYSYDKDDNRIVCLSKLAKDKYIELISSCDVCVSLIYSAHPGVIAYQAAASGIPTVTNTFGNRSKDILEMISSNIVPYNPLKESLLEKIETAMTRTKGKKVYNSEILEKNDNTTIAKFIDRISVSN
ncbi:hypothetical protein OAM25_02495 [Gammaproteobacteria bacterium]|nr:hypothetical protein [Gammaproteobacteria bacterium]